MEKFPTLIFIQFDLIANFSNLLSCFFKIVVKICVYCFFFKLERIKESIGEGAAPQVPDQHG